ncbi:MAG: ABC transporter ATP-binding protein [Phycisphaerae bacterium]
MLEIRDLAKSYRKSGRTVDVLAGAGLNLEAGQFVAVQGASGCGKTTLLLIAGGLMAPDSGGVLIDGRDPYAMSAEQRAAFRATTVGFVFQQFHLVPYLSVLDNVRSPSLAAGGDGRDRAAELIEHFGLSGRAHHLPSELSTGERQRAALARALLNRPKLLLADEPTGNLDANNAKVVLGYLGEFAASGGAVLLVTHDVNAAAHAQRTLHLKDGRIA